MTRRVLLSLVLAGGGVDLVDVAWRDGVLRSARHFRLPPGHVRRDPVAGPVREGRRGGVERLTGTGDQAVLEGVPPGPGFGPLMRSCAALESSATFARA